MKTLIFSISALLTFSTYATTGTPISKAEYVNSWKNSAIEEMMLYKIPASITLAQGILESASGNSDLAREGNNHFGIKCHDWTGKKMYKDDDSKGECFRVYESAEESFRDHSLFLVNRSRYAKLFTYETTDYKSWAKGLKEAGYATNPKYPDLLIDLIESLGLAEYDKMSGTNLYVENELTKPKVESKDGSNTAANSSSAHTVYTHSNKVKYVVAQKGDTYYRIASEFGLTLGQLYRYNDTKKGKDVLEPGDIVNIFPKRLRAKEKSKTIVSARTILDIAQEEGVKVEHLMKLNNITSEQSVIEKGEKVILR